MCDHRGWTGHPLEQCFDLHPELKFGVEIMAEVLYEAEGIKVVEMLV